MRISTGYQFETYTRDIGTAFERYIQAQRQVSTGKKLELPSDDPLGAARVLSYRKLRDGIEQYQENLLTAKGYLGFTEEALSEVGTIMRRAYQLAVAGANGATDQSGREGMVRELNEMQRRLVELGNQRGPNGQYIFAGQQTETRPFSLVGNVFTFNGDNLDVAVETGPGTTMAANTPAEALFGDAWTAIENLKTNLQGANLGAMSGQDIPALQASMDAVGMARGVAGSKLSAIQGLEADYERRVDEFTRQISDVEDVDLTEAVTKYRLAETAYQAALQVAGQGFQFSLMDFIRS
jgi:flagellar hook-associated protein 3 FlgL